MFAAIVFSLLIVGLLYCFQYYRRWYEKYAPMMKLPGPRNYPFIGNLWPLMLIPRSKWLKYMERVRQKYGTLIRVCVGMHPVVICANAEDADIILSSRVNIEKSLGYQFLKSWLGSGLLVSGGGGKYVIPADTSVQVNIFAIHRQEKYFPNPLEFNPDNFSLENVRNRHPFSFIPFSAGLRNCIGQKFANLEEKVLLSTLFRNFKVKSSQKMENLKIYPDIVLRHEKGILVNIEKRVW